MMLFLHADDHVFALGPDEPLFLHNIAAFHSLAVPSECFRWYLGH